MTETVVNSLLTCFFVMMRMTGMVFFNPILGRSNIPVIFRMGVVLILSYLVLGLLPVYQWSMLSWIGFSLLLLKELVIGYLLGLIVSMALSVFIISGELIDMQMGISMAKLYDPQSNVSMPIVGSIFNALFILLFFVSNAHLAVISLMIQSFQMIPLGNVIITQHTADFVLSFFGVVLELSIKLALPMIVVQLLSEVAVGVIMKVIPQINVFVLNLELKLLIGFLVIFMLVPEFCEFTTLVLQVLVQNLQQVVQGLFS